MVGPIRTIGVWDRRTWLRRVSLDLTGLPPTPEQLDAFVRDQRADAYELAEALPVVETYGLAALCRALLNSNEFVFLP